MVDETQYYNVIRGAGLYRCADGTTVRITGFRPDYVLEFEDKNIHCWATDHEAGVAYCPDGISCTRPDSKAIVAGPLPEEPRPGETWYAQLNPDRPDVKSVYVIDVTEHTVKISVPDSTTFPIYRTRRMIRDAVKFVERVS